MQQLTAADPAPGTGFIEIERVGAKSVGRRIMARAPLRLLTPGNHGSAAWIYLSSFGGGLVGGDRIDLRVDVAAGAEAVLLSQSSTKVYRSPSGASQRLRATVGPGGLLVSMPDPVACFAGSSFEQEQHVDLDDGASLVLCEAVTGGRIESGERWEFDRYRSRVSVSRKGRPLFRETLLLDAGAGALPGRFGRFNVVGMALLLGPDCERAGRRIGEELGRKTPGRAEGFALSISPIGGASGGEGWVLRVAAASAEAAALELRRLLEFLPERLGDNPWARKW